MDRNQEIYDNPLNLLVASFSGSNRVSTTTPQRPDSSETAIKILTITMNIAASRRFDPLL